MRWPSWMPAGTSTSIWRSSTTTPAPVQVWHGCSMITPRPAHCGHACVRTNWPSGLRVTCCSRPVPSQRGQRGVSVPGSTPSPPHVPQRDGDLERHLDLLAARRLDELDLDLRADVCAAATRPAAGAEEVVAEERREEVAEIAEVEVASAGTRPSASRRARTGRRRRVSRSSTAPRTPRSPRGSALRSRAPSTRRDAARARAGGTPS